MEKFPNLRNNYFLFTAMLKDTREIDRKIAREISKWSTAIPDVLLESVFNREDIEFAKEILERFENETNPETLYNLVPSGLATIRPPNNTPEWNRVFSKLSEIQKELVNSKKVTHSKSLKSQYEYRACCDQIAEANARTVKVEYYKKAIRRYVCSSELGESCCPRIHAQAPNFFEDCHQAIMAEVDQTSTSEASQNKASQALTVNNRITVIVDDFIQKYLNECVAEAQDNYDSAKKSSKKGSAHSNQLARRLLKLKLNQEGRDNTHTIKERITLEMKELFSESKMISRRESVEQWLRRIEQTPEFETTKTDNELTAKHKEKKKKKKGRKKEKVSVDIHTPVATAAVGANQPALMTPPVRSLEQQRYDQCSAWFTEYMPPVHQRVKRWKTPSLETVKAFTDTTPDGSIVKKYEHKNIDELRLLKIYHDLSPTERLINNPFYRFPTPSGCGLICLLVIGGANPSTKHGTIYFGIDKTKGSLVYHRMFEEQSDKASITEILSGPSSENVDYQTNVDVERESSEIKEEFEEVGSYQLFVSETGVIQISYNKKDLKIFIYPSRMDLLPKGLFVDPRRP